MKVMKKLFNKTKTSENAASEKTELSSLTFTQLVDYVPKVFGHSADLMAIKAEIHGIAACFFYLESMIEPETLKKTTAKLISTKDGMEKLTCPEEFVALCKESFGGIKHNLLATREDVISSIVNGSLAIVLSEPLCGVSVLMPSQEKRAVQEPPSQTIVRGPREGFTETISVNVSLIRKRIRNENLHFEKFIVGDKTRTSVYIGYVHGIANQSIIEEVRKRVGGIRTDAVFESGNIEEMISDKTATVFPLALNTERADTAAANLMDGKIIIMVDGSPFCLIVPAVFVNFFEISEDYYEPFLLGSFLRIIRYLSFMLAILTPSIYVGILTFHHELLPTTLLLSVISQREGVPFPAVAEVLLMEITFEILREAGIRSPKMTGQMVSIVGALVIGQAAAEAGIISNTMIIVVAITAIASFASPVYSFAAAARLIRFVLVIAASVLGLYGVLLLLIVMVAHLCSLRSFGVPYLAPVAPFILEDQKDVFVRFPWWAMKSRPEYNTTAEPVKTRSDGSPSPPDMVRGDER